MDYKRMASEYLEEVARIDRRLEQLRRGETAPTGRRTCGCAWAR